MTYTKPWEQGALKVTENGRYFSCGIPPFSGWEIPPGCCFTG